LEGNGFLDAWLKRAWVKRIIEPAANAGKKIVRSIQLESVMPSPQKKRKLSSKLSSQRQQKIDELEKRLNDAIFLDKSLNYLTDLIQLTRKCSDPRDVHKGVWSLYRVFTRLIKKNRVFGLGAAVSAEAKTVQRWLAQQLGEYTTYLLSLFQDDEQSLRVSICHPKDATFT
jgi:hypothetical protein